MAHVISQLEKTFTMDAFFRLLVVAWLVCFLAVRTLSQHYTVRRMVNQTADIFEVDKLTCSIDFCSKRNASSVSASNNCKCQCGTKPFLTFSNNRGSCVDGREIRRQEGCTVFMAGNDLSSQLMTLADGQRERLNVYPKSTSDPASCYIDHSISSYLHCNGSWEKISSKVYERFYLLPGDGRHLDIQVRKEIKDKSVLNGRVIQIGFTKGCRMDAPTQPMRLCLLLKLQGVANCGMPVVNPTSNSKNGSVSTHKYLSRTTTSFTIPSKVATSSVTSSSQPTTPSSETIKPSSIDKNRVMGKQSKTFEDKTILVLAGTISAAAVLIAITVALVMVKNRRKTGTTPITREYATDEDGYAVPSDGWKAALNKAKTYSLSRINKKNSGEDNSTNVAYDEPKNDIVIYACTRITTSSTSAPRRSNGLVYDYALPEMAMRSFKDNNLGKLNNRLQPPPVPYKKNNFKQRIDPAYCDLDRVDPNDRDQKQAMIRQFLDLPANKGVSSHDAATPNNGIPTSGSMKRLTHVYTELIDSVSNISSKPSYTSTNTKL